MPARINPRSACLASLLLVGCLGLQAEGLEKAVNAYNELLQRSVTDGRPPKPAEVAKVLDELKSHFNEYPEAFLKAGDFYFRIGLFDMAIRQYQEGEVADSSNKVAYQKRTIEVLIREHKNAEAWEMDNEILRDHPEDPEARGLEASFRLDKGETDAAISELQSVIEAAPTNFVARFNLGRAYFAKGDLEEARQHFEAALELKPDYKPARLALTQLALRRGDPDSALRYSQAALQMDPNSGVAQLMEAAALLRKGRYDDSRTLLVKILEADPNQADALLELGVLNLTQKRLEDAKDPFRRAYTKDPANLRGLLGLAEIQFQENQPEKAVQLIANEAKNRPERRDLQKELANTEFRAKQFDRAIAGYEAVLNLYKDTPVEQADIYNRLGVTYSTLGNNEKAIESLLRATQLAPSNVGYISTLAQFYDHAGKQQEALTNYREALKLDPNNGTVMNNLAYLVAQMNGDLDEALRLAQGARQLLPAMDEISDTIGWIYLKKNLTASAIEVFRDLTAKVKTNPTFHLHYAMALAQKGDRAGASEEFEAAEKCQPSRGEEDEIQELRKRIDKLPN